jgi:hypothetical protein
MGVKKNGLRRFRDLIRINANPPLARWTFKLNLAGLHGKESVIAADANVHAWVKLRSALPNDNVAGLNNLAAVLLNAKHLGLGISTVSG